MSFFLGSPPGDFACAFFKTPSEIRAMVVLEPDDGTGPTSLDELLHIYHLDTGLLHRGQIGKNRGNRCYRQSGNNLLRPCCSVRPS
jgi:hypothetical protein